MKTMLRAGHEGFETTKMYLREAENLSRGFGEVFPALPQCLLGNRPESPRGDSLFTKQPKAKRKLVAPPGLERHSRWS